MGTTNQKGVRPSIDSQDEEDLQFYMQVEDPNMGTVEIYKHKRIRFAYILKSEQQAADSRIYNLFKKIEQSQSPFLLSLYGFSMRRQTCCCGKLNRQIITSYWEYYNFYFSDYLSKRAKLGCQFTENQIWHIVTVVCNTYALCRKFNVFYEVDPSTFLIDLEGRLKALWSHLKSQNSHMKFIRYFETQQIESSYYSPEELEYISLRERTVKLNFDKCNSFRLGMVLLYCLSLTDPLHMCYNLTLTKINFTVIRNVIMGKVANRHSQDITALVMNLLMQDPEERMTLLEVAQQYQQFMSNESYLRDFRGKDITAVDYRRSETLRRNIQHLQSSARVNQPLPVYPHHQSLLYEQDMSRFSDAKTVKFTHTSSKI